MGSTSGGVCIGGGGKWADLSVLESIHTGWKRKFSLMFEFFSLIYLTVSSIFFVFAFAFAWCEIILRLIYIRAKAKGIFCVCHSKLALWCNDDGAWLRISRLGVQIQEFLFLERKFCFWKERPSLISLFLNSKYKNWNVFQSEQHCWRYRRVVTTVMLTSSVNSP